MRRCKRFVLWLSVLGLLAASNGEAEITIVLKLAETRIRLGS